MQKIVFLSEQFAVTSALTADDIAEAARLGFGAILSNLPDGEMAEALPSRDEARIAWRHGMQFRHVPADRHDVMSDDIVESVADALIGLRGPVLAHCRSGTRSAIIWAAASARMQPVDCVLEALAKAGFDLDFLRDDLEQQAHRARWIAPSPALDCGCPSDSEAGTVETKAA